METIQHEGFTVTIAAEEDSRNPRHEYDNLGHFVAFHKRYDLGDKEPKLRSADFSGWAALEKHLRTKEKAAFILPVYMLDHSGLRVSTESFRCPWDSGQIGFIYATRAEVLKNFQVTKLSKRVTDAVYALLRSEIEVLDQYLRGDVWYFTVEDADGEVLDSCGDMYGFEYCKTEALGNAKRWATKFAAEAQALADAENTLGAGI